MVSQNLTVHRVPLSSLHLDPSNARLHGEINLEAIIGSLKRFGQAEPLVIQSKTGRVIGGNGRLVAMQKLGWTECEAVMLDLDDLTATALGIALNRTSELAEWDEGTLAKLLSELRAEDALAGVGFSNDDIDQLLKEIEEELPPEDLEDPGPGEIPINPITQPGDLWILGEHRLLCGDSGSIEDLDLLLSGEKIQLVHTDPPYNVKVEPRSNNAIAAGLSSFTAATKPQAKLLHHQSFDLARRKVKPHRTGKMRAKDRPLINDFVSDEEFDRLLLSWFGNMARVLQPGRSFYIWGGYANLGNYPAPLKKAGLYFSQGIVWDKEHPVLTRKDFMGAFELCFYGWKEGAGHQYFGPNNATDLWHVKKVNPQSMIHLTEKPVELAVQAMTCSSRRGENVLDLFAGSGSTLMAGQMTHRKVYSMEMDAAYCDVIVTRFEKATGIKAFLHNTNQTFAEVSLQRGEASQE